MNEGQTSDCDGVLVPQESLRAAVLCARETVPTLEANLKQCESLSRIKLESLYAILVTKDHEIKELRGGPGVLMVAGYVLSGALIGAAITAGAMVSR